MSATNLTCIVLAGRGWSLLVSPFIPSSFAPKSPLPTAISDVPFFSDGQNTQMYSASAAVLAQRSHREDRCRIQCLNHSSINSDQW